MNTDQAPIAFSPAVGIFSPKKSERENCMKINLNKVNFSASVKTEENVSIDMNIDAELNYEISVDEAIQLAKQNISDIKELGKAYIKGMKELRGEMVPWAETIAEVQKIVMGSMIPVPVPPDISEEMDEETEEENEE